MVPAHAVGLLRARAARERAGLLAVGAFVTGPTTALFGAWLAHLARRGRAGPFAAGAGFVAAELARTLGPVAAPWALSGYLLADTAFAQCADLAGAWGVGFVAAVANAGVASLAAPALRPRSRARSLRSRGSSRLRSCTAALGARSRSTPARSSPSR